MREIAFEFDGQPVTVSIDKVDRDKLYGAVEEHVTDEHGSPCELATLADDGRTLVPRGGTALAYLDGDGRQIDRQDLTPLTPAGDPIEPTPSSFKVAPVLDAEATPDDLLLTATRLVYAVTPSHPLPDALRERLDAGAIFTFPFAYRESLDPDTAFLLRGHGGGTFLLAGSPLDVEYVAHTRHTPADDDGDGDLDFGLL